MKTALTYLLLAPAALFAGIGKDTVQLDEVVKVETVSNGNSVNTTPFTDLKYRTGERLGDALSEFSSVYIKSYGSGGLATFAICGTSAEQTEIEWNGIRLNSPSLGQMDLSLLMIGTQDELQLVRTGSEGNIGGILKLNNEVKRDSGFSIAATFKAGSFGTYNATLNADYAKRKFSGSTKVVYLRSLNDFPYTNYYAAGNPTVWQTNATVNQLSVLQQFNAKINPDQELNFYGWYNGSARELPPLMSEPADAQSQYDYSIRLMADWKGNFKGVKLKYTTAWMEDYLHYIDTDALINEVDRTFAWRNKLDVSYLFPCNLSLKGEVNYDREQANIPEYGTNKVRNTTGLRAYADYYLLGQLRFHAGFREDLVDKQLSAFAPEVSVNYSPKLKGEHALSFNLMASRNFRFPTLDELYWVPGGNPDLYEEKSWNGEIRVKYSWNRIIDFSVSNFYIYATNWIQWVPAGANWDAENFRKVFSRGVEAAIHLTNERFADPNKFSIHFNASYTYTKATNLEAISSTDLSQGKQLIYVPYHNLTMGLQLGYRRFYIRSVNTYTGPVFITTDNSQSLNGYFIPNLEAGKDFMLGKLDLGVSFRVNNIGNLQYQVVADRPMPGRNFEGIFRFKFLS